MVTQETKIPEQSVLKAEEQLFDYVDSFQSTFLGNEGNNDIIPIVELFVSSGPKWADTLLEIRNKIVKPFGLKTSDDINEKQKVSDSNRYELGSRHGIFKLLHKTENEIILGEDDKHLNFKVSLLLEPIHGADKRLSVTTAVKFNNMFGKLYFLPVKPFHKLIVRKTLEGIVKKVECQKEVTK